MNLKFFLTFAVLELATSWILPPHRTVLELPSSLNNTLSHDGTANPSARNYNNTTSSAPLNDWPDLPFRFKVSEGPPGTTTYILIDQYLAPSTPDSWKGAVLGNITNIEKLIESWEQPSYYIDNSRVFISGLVKVRFPAAVHFRNPVRITNALAVELLGAAWQMQYLYGPRGWSFASIETEDGEGVRNTVGFFSLWMIELRVLGDVGAWRRSERD